MPKKAARNAFYYFMKDIEPALRREGRVLNGMQDIVPIAHPRWMALSETEKERYEKFAKSEKARMRGVEGDKYKVDCVGNVIAYRRDEDKELDKRKQKERRSVSSQWPPGKDVADECFYLLNFQTLCKTEEGYYLPAEIGAIEFSIRKGITKKLHWFIEPGKIPLGYRSECKVNSEDKHHIPIENFEKAQSNYSLLWNQLENFCNPNGEKSEYPPYYCLNKDIDEMRYCLEWVFNRACRGSANRLRKVYDLGYLLVDLQAHIGNQISVTNAIDLLTSSSWDYEPNTRCDFHEENECKFCSLGIIQRYAFAMADCLCKCYDIPLTKKHLPVRPEGEPAVVVLPQSAMGMEKAKGGWQQQSNWNRSKGWSNANLPRQQPVVIQRARYGEDKSDDDEEDDDDYNPPALRRPNIPAGAALGGYSSRTSSWAGATSSNVVAPSMSDNNFPSLGRGITVAPPEDKFAGRAMAPSPNSAPVPPSAWQNDIRPAVQGPPGFSQQKAEYAMTPAQRPLGVRPIMNPLQQRPSVPHQTPAVQPRMTAPLHMQAPSVRGSSAITSGYVRGRGRGILGNITPGKNVPVGRGYYPPSVDNVQAGIHGLAISH